MGGSNSRSEMETFRKVPQSISSEDVEPAFWSRVPLFRCLPPDEYQNLQAASERVNYSKNQTIIYQGEEGSDFYIIKEGLANISIDGAVQATLKSGDYFGEASLLTKQPRNATIVAMTPLKALKISQLSFQRLGLREKLVFPKREKVNKRHKMLAGGVAGVSTYRNSNTNLHSDLDDAAGRLDESLLVQRSAASSSQGYWGMQLRALREIFTDKLILTAFFLVPMGQVAVQMELGEGIIFASNFLAIIPLASLLGAATEALSTHTGQLIGGLLNATFGNAVEMIMCVQAVKAGLINVVQGNLLGSMLSNLLLVLGMAIFASGVVRKSQEFNAKGASANMSCQLVASISICLPTVFANVSGQHEEHVLEISRVCSIFLMIVYGLFLFFMLKTHADLFADDSSAEEDEGGLSPLLSTLLLFACTVLVFWCSEALVDSIEDVSETYGLSQTFIGVILMPIVGNAAEHATAVTAAYKGMMDLALGVAVGSSTQIALFVVPCAVMFGWIYDQPMNLNFTVFDTTCQMLTVFLVSQVLSHGETNWLYGAMLCTVYLFIAVQTLYIP